MHQLQVMTYKMGGIFTFTNESPVLIKAGKHSFPFLSLVHLSATIDCYYLVNLPSWKIIGSVYTTIKVNFPFLVIGKWMTLNCLVMIFGILKDKENQKWIQFEILKQALESWLFYLVLYFIITFSCSFFLCYFIGQPQGS